VKLTVIKENDDGSADVKLENINPTMMQLILQTGLIKLLEEAITKAEKENKLPSLLKANNG